MSPHHDCDHASNAHLCAVVYKAEAARAPSLAVSYNLQKKFCQSGSAASIACALQRILRSLRRFEDKNVSRQASVSLRYLHEPRWEEIQRTQMPVARHHRSRSCRQRIDRTFRNSAVVLLHLTASAQVREARDSATPPKLTTPGFQRTHGYLGLLQLLPFFRSKLTRHHARIVWSTVVNCPPPNKPRIGEPAHNPEGGLIYGPLLQSPYSQRWLFQLAKMSEYKSLSDGRLSEGKPSVTSQSEGLGTAMHRSRRIVGIVSALERNQSADTDDLAFVENVLCTTPPLSEAPSKEERRWKTIQYALFANCTLLFPVIATQFVPGITMQLCTKIRFEKDSDGALGL